VSGRTHVVVPGDNLWRIATEESCESMAWRHPMRRSFRTGAVVVEQNRADAALE
jgi:hypothetical protein